MKKILLITVGAAALAASEVDAKVVPATPFADNMVLQRERVVPDGKFKPAVVVNKSHKGNYSGKELVVKAAGVAQPRAIRYLYSKPWIGSLYSADSGLPLGPFELREQ